MSRAAVAILSTENLVHNLGVLKRQAPNSKVIAMIKANAYGHGLRSVGLRLEKAGVENLGVASIDEAMNLRSAGVKIPITLMEGVFQSKDLLIASCQNFHVVIHNLIHIQWLMSISVPNPLKIWLKIDTGMGRLGFQACDASALYDQLSTCANAQQPIGIMSHFACAERQDDPLNHQQISVFKEFVDQKSSLSPKSLANSAAVFNFSNIHYDTIRPGLSLYGVSPFMHVPACDLNLRPVMTLQSELIAVRTFKKGSTIGYGGRYVCPKDMLIGVVAIGYGDGYPRTSDGTPVLINNVRCQSVGRISMDMMTVDLSCYPQAQIGNTVTLWGKNLPIEEVASHTPYTPYEMLCATQSRVKFFWTMF